VLIIHGISGYAQISIFSGDDTLKGNIKKLTEYVYVSDYLITNVYIWDTIEKSVTGSIYYNKDSLIGKRTARYNDERQIIEKRLYCMNDELCEKLIHTYDDKGRKTMSTCSYYSNSSKEDVGRYNTFSDVLMGGVSHWAMAIDSTVVQLTYKYDSKGNLTEGKKIEITNGKRYSDTSIYITYTSYHADNNKIMSERKITTHSSNKYADTAVSFVAYEYDITGNKIKENAYSLYPQNKYILRGDSIISVTKIKVIIDSTKVTYKYNSDHELIEDIVYHAPRDINYSKYPGRDVGRVNTYTYNKLTSTTTTTEYDIYREDDGTEKRYFDREREVVTDDGTRVEYDGVGNVTKKMSDKKVWFTRQIEYY